MIEDFFITLSESPLTYPILFILISVCIFVLGRFLFCWYWKIDERIALQKKQCEMMQELIALQKEQILLLKNKPSEADLQRNTDIINDTAAFIDDILEKMD